MSSPCHTWGVPSPREGLQYVSDGKWVLWWCRLIEAQPCPHESLPFCDCPHFIKRPSPNTRDDLAKNALNSMDPGTGCSVSAGICSWSAVSALTPAGHVKGGEKKTYSKGP